MLVLPVGQARIMRAYRGLLGWGYRVRPRELDLVLVICENST